MSLKEPTWGLPLVCAGTCAPSLSFFLFSSSWLLVFCQPGGTQLSGNSQLVKWNLLLQKEPQYSFTLIYSESHCYTSQVGAIEACFQGLLLLIPPLAVNQSKSDSGRKKLFHPLIIHIHTHTQTQELIIQFLFKKYVHLTFSNQFIFDHCFMDWWLFLLLVQPVFQHQVDDIAWFVHLLIHHLTKSNWEPVTF